MASKQEKRQGIVVSQLFVVCECLFLLCSDSIFPRPSSDFFISADMGQAHQYVQEGDLILHLGKMPSDKCHSLPTPVRGITASAITGRSQILMPALLGSMETCQLFPFPLCIPTSIPGFVRRWRGWMFLSLRFGQEKERGSFGSETQDINYMLVGSPVGCADHCIYQNILGCIFWHGVSVPCPTVFAW